MVFDKLEHASLYYGLGPRFRQALEWLAQVDPAALPSGQRVDIDGDNIYATRFDVDTKRPEEAKLECHRNYADIQYVVSGTEGVGYALCLDQLINTTGDSSLCFRPLENQVTAGMDLVWKKYQVFSKAAEKFLEAVREQMESWDT